MKKKFDYQPFIGLSKGQSRTFKWGASGIKPIRSEFERMGFEIKMRTISRWIAIKIKDDEPNQ